MGTSNKSFLREAIVVLLQCLGTKNINSSSVNKTRNGGRREGMRQIPSKQLLKAPMPRRSQIKKKMIYNNCDCKVAVMFHNGGKLTCWTNDLLHGQLTVMLICTSTWWI